MVETVLAGILEELSRIKSREEEQTKLLNEVMQKLEASDQRLKEQKSASQPFSTAMLETVIMKEVAKLKQTIEAQPKTIKKEHRILLFPEYNVHEYYRLVFGRLFFWLFVILLSTYLFVLGKEAIQSWYTVHSQEKELNECKIVWQELYKTLHEKEKKQKSNLH